MKIAFDRSSRHIDADGRLHVARSHISKATVNPYYGREIPGAAELGLDPDRVYRLLRDPVELERAAPTFARLPVLSEHVPVTVDAPRPELVVGAIGSDVEFSAPYLDADLCIWDAEAIAGIETDKVRELSCSYRYVPVMEPGQYEGQPYDGRMTEIQGNHLALVEVGRAGSDVIVADHDPFARKTAVKMSKTGKALFVALCAASPVLAADSAVAALVGAANRKTFDKPAVKAKLLALDAAIDSQKLDAILDAILDVEQDPTTTTPPTDAPPIAKDETPADKVRALLSGKVDDSVISDIIAMIAPPAGDAAPDSKKEDGMKKEEVAAAMDAMRKEFREANEARVDVRPVVGDVLGMDSAADVYAFALDHLKIDRKDVAGTPALRALFRVAASKQAAAPVPIVAQDSAGAATKFPGLARIRQA